MINQFDRRYLAMRTPLQVNDVCREQIILTSNILRRDKYVDDMSFVAREIFSAVSARDQLNQTDLKNI